MQAVTVHHRRCLVLRKRCTCLVRDEGTQFFQCCGQQCIKCEGWVQ